MSKQECVLHQQSFDSPQQEEFDLSVLADDPSGFAHNILWQVQERINSLAVRDPYYVEALGFKQDQIAELLPSENQEAQEYPHVPLSVGVSDEAILSLYELLTTSEDSVDRDIAIYLMASANNLQTLASDTEITPRSNHPQKDDTRETSIWTIGNVDMLAIAEAIASEINSEMASDGLMGIGQVLAVAHKLGYTIPVDDVLRYEKDLGYVTKDGRIYLSARQFGAVAALLEKSKNGGITREHRKMAQTFVKNTSSVNGATSE